MATYRSAAQEWSAEYNHLHAIPGKRGPVRLSRQGARILGMLSPYPWEPGHADVDIRGETLSWQPQADDFIVGHAHSARSTGFPEGDAKRILAAFRHHGGEARTRHQYPRYVVYFDGNPQSRWDDRDEARLVAERAVAGRPGHTSGVIDTHTGKTVERHDTRGHSRRRGFSLVRHSHRARYRNR